MARRKSVAFLPQYLQTETTKKFLQATFDQLLTSSSLKKLDGFVGRKLAPTFETNDNYLTEPNVDRSNYQLEPSVVTRNDDGKPELISDYSGIMNTIDYLGGITSRHDRLWEQKVYNYNGLIDLDKLVNFSEYYWLPSGPDSVQVFSGNVPTSSTFTITKGNTGYTISGQAGDNPTISVARGGSYNFVVNQGTKFWLQTETGTSGVSAQQINLSTREILGVSNNGEDVGTVVFNPPVETAQDNFILMTIADTVNLATTLNFDQINGVALSTFLDTHNGIDGQRNITNKKIVFVVDGDSDQGTNAGDVWLLTESSGTIVLTKVTDINNNEKVSVGEGTVYGNREIYKNAEGKLELVPPITAPDEFVYYQDGTDASFVGKIKIVEANASPIIDVEDEIIGRKVYTSPNGVAFTSGLKIEFDSNVTPASYANAQFYVDGVGESITLTPVDELVTPETFTANSSLPFDSKPFDVGGFETTVSSPTNKDYIVCRRDSMDRNPWSRHNRWFHIDVITATAGYNNFTPVLDQDARAKRPIIEYKPNLQLFNFGRIGTTPVDIIDNTQTDALSNVEGQLSYFADGIELTDGIRIIWSADTDVNVANKIYEVQLIDPDNNGTNQVHLVEISTVLDQSVVISELGATNQGKSFKFINSKWSETQQKTAVNQSPLFDVFDNSDISFSDLTTYPASSFTGTKLFDYKRGTGSVDTELGFALSYKTFNNVGDIQFVNNLASDTFTFVSDGSTNTKNVSDGSARTIVSSSSVTQASEWTTSSIDIRQYQLKEFTLNSSTDNIALNAVLDTDTTVPNLSVYVNGDLVTDYITSTQNNRTIITFSSVLAAKTLIIVRFLSNTAEPDSFYEIPTNLELNADNEAPKDFTLGQLRNHIKEIGLNTTDLIGESLGANNFRDLGDYAVMPGRILQNSGTFIPAGLFH